MNKIVVDYVYKNYFSARSKAREDVNTIAQRNGYVPFLINTRTTTEQAAIGKMNPVKKLFYNLRKLLILFQSINAIPKGTEVLFQYPFAPFGETFTLFFCRRIKKKHCRVRIMVHDLVHYRETLYFNPKEINILNTASELIVHTPQMKNLFQQFGIHTPCRILWLFDYITDEIPRQEFAERNSIAFAGALDKSVFLQQMKTRRLSNIELHLYGGQPHSIEDYPNWMSYMGRFAPENVTMLKEDWGLVWDGTSVDSLQGVIGNYLKYIAPHKTSLYLAAGIPVIISKESALAEYVEMHKLGITVASIADIEQIMANVTESDLQEIRHNVMIISEKLRHGEMLSSVLNG